MADVRISGETLEVPNLESAFSAMSWGAIFAGAIAAVATSLVLFTLGPGLGFAAVSPYGDGASLAALGIAAGVWIIFVQWVSSALGGYLAGRLRAKWAVKESDEVFFRDTAHGLLAWGVATILMASLFAHAGLGILSAGAGATQGAAQVAAASGADDYALDARLSGGRRRPTPPLRRRPRRQPPDKPATAKRSAPKPGASSCAASTASSTRQTAPTLLRLSPRNRACLNRKLKRASTRRSPRRGKRLTPLGPRQPLRRSCLPWRLR